MRKPYITFVMPCYQAQVYLAESIKSVLNQTVKNIELIVVNDCSTDASREIIDHYQKQDDRVRCIDLKVNGGMSNARNVGNMEAKANIIAVQDADDLSLENRAATILRNLKKSKCPLFYSSYTMINGHNHVGESFLAQKFNINTVYERRLAFVGHPTMAYKKSLILKHPYQDGKWSRLGCEDFRLITELWKCGVKFCFSKSRLVLYRWHQTNSTRTRSLEEVNALKDEYIKTYLKGAGNEDSKDVLSAK